MTEIGRQEGYEMVVVASPASQTALTRAMGGNTSGVSFVAPRAGDGDVWYEDSREIDGSGTTRVPARMRGPTGAVAPGSALGQQLQDEQLDARRERFALPENASRWNQHGRAGDGFTDLAGAVAQRDHTRDAAGHALSQNRPFTENLTFFEGGNILRGTRDGAPYAVVGHDSLAMARGNLQRELQRPVSVDETRRAMAYDLGVSPTRLTPVEQAGEFHLDMAMMAVPSGGIVVNDSRAAASLEAQWWRDDLARSGTPTASDSAALDVRIADNTRRAEQRAYYEDLAVRDLAVGGVPVHRMAGNFGHGEEGMNFMNGEAGTAPDGSTYMVLLGGDERAQDHVRRSMAALPLGIDRVHFLPPEVTRDNLANMGGLNCRIKSEGSLTRCPSCGRPHGAHPPAPPPPPASSTRPRPRPRQ